MTPPSKRELELDVENAELRVQLVEAEETLRAIRSGEVDALVVGEEVYTLKGAETPYRVLIESMNEGAATLAPDGTILYCNRRFAELVDTTAEQVMGSILSQHVVPAQQPIVRSLVATAREAGARAELTFSVPGGPGRPVLISLRPFHLDTATIGMVAADLTERKRAEAALQQAHNMLEQRVAERTQELQRANQSVRESERRFRSVLDNAMDCIYRVNLQSNRFDYISPSSEKIVGFAPEELMKLDAKTALAMIHPDDLPAMRAALARLEQTGALEIEYRQRAKSGDYRWVSNHMSLTRDSGGQPVYRDGTLRDITERKRAEQALKASYEELERFNRAMVGRELRMIELKKEVNDLCAQFGQPSRYGRIAEEP